MTRSALCLALALLAGGCSSTSQGAALRAPAPFPAELLRYFDDAVDYIENPEELGGRLAADWRTQIEQLSRESELVMPVRVETISEGTEANAAAAYTLTAVASGPAVKGTVPRDRHVSLRASEGSTGFNTVRNNIARVQSREYLLFARGYTDEDGQARLHWHLSPLTPHLLQRVRETTGYNDPNSGVTVIRQQ